MGGFVFNSSGSVSAFDVGITGLNAARIALQVTGHNIANVDTEGYSRQVVIRSTADPAITTFGALGRGVEVVKIQALRDRFLEVQLSVEGRELSRLETTDNILGQVETILNPLSGGGVTDAINNLFGGFSDLSANPESTAQREELLSLANSLAKQSNSVISSLERLTQSINEQVEATLDEINSVLNEIADLNTRITAGESTGQPVEDYRDRRAVLLQDLNELVGVETFQNSNGSTTVVTNNGVPLVVQEQAATLSTLRNSLDPNKLDVIATFSSTPYNITEQVDSGRLGALIAERDGTISDLISAQRQFNAILADVINIQHRMGTDINGDAGGDFFEDPFSVADVSALSDILGVTIVGDNATFEVNYDVYPSSAANVTAIDINDASLLTKMDYRIDFTSATGDYDVVNTTTGQTVGSGTLVGLTATFDGLDVTFDALPAAGDSFELDFAGRTGVTGDVYRIEFNAAGDYEVFDTTTGDSTPIATGTLAGAGFIFFDGLAVEFDSVPADGDFFTIGYSGLEVSSTLTADTIAASDSAVGTAEPGNNSNALLLAEIAETALGGLDNKTFAQYQSSEVTRVGTLKSDTASLLESQESLVESLQTQRDEISGVSLDEEAAALIEFQQAYQANARYISTVSDLTDYLISVLVG